MNFDNCVTDTMLTEMLVKFCAKYA